MHQVLLKLSKDEANDALFREEKAASALLALLNDTLALAQLKTSSRKKKAGSSGEGGGGNPPAIVARAGDLPFPFDVLIYACGALKNISQNDSNQKSLGQQGAGQCQFQCCACMSKANELIP
jgi:hypothetical protein